MGIVHCCLSTLLVGSYKRSERERRSARIRLERNRSTRGAAVVHSREAISHGGEGEAVGPR
eukprot:7334948-Prymnesium_polylepis.1